MSDILYQCIGLVIGVIFMITWCYYNIKNFDNGIEMVLFGCIFSFFIVILWPIAIAATIFGLLCWSIAFFMVHKKNTSRKRD